MARPGIPSIGSRTSAPDPGPTLVQLLQRAGQAIAENRPFVDLGDRWAPLQKELERLWMQPDTAVSRQQARTLLANIADVAGMPGLASDAWSYVQSPLQGVETTLGLRDVSGRLYTTNFAKACDAARRGVDQLPGEVQRQLKALVDPWTLFVLACVVTLWALAQLAPPLGQFADVGLILWGGKELIEDLLGAGQDLKAWIDLSCQAKTDEDLDQAGARFARAITTTGVDTILTLITSSVFARVKAKIRSEPGRFGTPREGSRPAAEAGRPAEEAGRPGERAGERVDPTRPLAQVVARSELHRFDATRNRRRPQQQLSIGGPAVVGEERGLGPAGRFERIAQHRYPE